MVTVAIQPLVWLTLMGNMFEKVRAIPGFPAPSYLSYMAPGIIAMTVLFGGVYSGMSVIWDRRIGFMNKMLATPISRFSVVLGKMFSSAIRSGLQTAIILGAAVAMGVPLRTGPAGAVLLILIAMLLCLSFAGISLAVGAAVHVHETFFAITNFLTMPLIFTSSALFPLEFMPTWLRTAATYNPVTYAIDPIRILMISGWEWGTIIPDIIVVGLFTVGVASVSTYMFRRSVV